MFLYCLDPTKTTYHTDIYQWRNSLKIKQSTTQFVIE